MRQRFSQWMKRVRDTQDEEISCSVCLEHVSEYVDLELSSRDAAWRMPALKHHLDQCRVCNEEYQVLRELAGQGEGDHTASIEELVDKLKRNK